MQKCSPKYTTEIHFINTPLVLLFEGIDLFFSGIFHLYKANDIKAVECMCTVRWVLKNFYIVLHAVFEQISCIVGTVAIHEQDSCLTSGFLACLRIEIFLDPVKSEAAVCPAIF
jgi:hypothetical protein